MKNIHGRAQLLMIVVGAFLALTAASPQLLAALPEGVSPAEQQGPPTSSPEQVCLAQPNCIDSECIQYNYVINGSQGQSLKKAFYVPNGNCGAPLSGTTTNNCLTYPSVKCVFVDVYSSNNCGLGDGIGAMYLYRTGCKGQGAGDPDPL